MAGLDNFFSQHTLTKFVSGCSSNFLPAQYQDGESAGTSRNSCSESRGVSVGLCHVSAEWEPSACSRLRGRGLWSPLMSLDPDLEKGI